MQNLLFLVSVEYNVVGFYVSLTNTYGVSKMLREQAETTELWPAQMAITLFF